MKKLYVSIYHFVVIVRPVAIITLHIPIIDTYTFPNSSRQENSTKYLQRAKGERGVEKICLSCLNFVCMCGFA